MASCGPVTIRATTPLVLQPDDGQALEHRQIPCPAGLRALRDYFAMSLRLLRGWTLTTVRAGFALNTVSSRVKGLMPRRAFVAGFRRVLIYSRPGTVK